jgi:hypothetical protein
MAGNRSPLQFPEKLIDGDHLFQYCHSEEFLNEAVTNFIGAALMNGKGVLDADISQADHLRKIAALQFGSTAKARELKEWRMDSTELMIPLTSLKMQLQAIKNKMMKENMSEESLSAIFAKCESHLSRMHNFIKDIS